MNKIITENSMANRVFSFSIKPRDKEAAKLIQDLQLYSIKKGIKFNYMVMEGLKLYIAKEKINCE